MRACRSCCGHDAVEGVEGTRNGVLLILSRCGARGRLRFVTIVQRGWLAGTPCGTVTCVPFAAWPAERRGSAARCAATGELIGPECRQEPRERVAGVPEGRQATRSRGDRKSTRLNSSHSQISYAVFCLKKKITVLLLAEVGAGKRKIVRRIHGSSSCRREEFKIVSYAAHMAENFKNYGSDELIEYGTI